MNRLTLDRIQSAVCALGLVLAAASCTGPQTERAIGPANGIDVPIETMMLAADLDVYPVVTDLRTFDHLLENEGRLKPILRKVANGQNGTVENLIDAIRVGGGPNNNNSKAQGVSGLGGEFGHAFVDAVEMKLENGVVNAGWQINTKSTGQITAYEYRNVSGDGVLENIVTVTTTRTKPNGAQTAKTMAYKIKIRVEGGFKYTMKDLRDPDNVFPGAPGLKITAGVASGLDYKIYANGQAIKIEEVWVDQTGNGFQPNEQILASSTEGWKQQYKYLLDESDQACVDLMVATYTDGGPGHLPIPINWAELQAFVMDGHAWKYCLGRCKSPPLINTK